VGALKGRTGRYGTDNRLLRLLTLQFFRRSHDTLPEPFGSDLRQLGPIHVCPCGSQVFNVMCAFEDYEIVWYFLDATCVSCGNLVTVPCSVDAE
jgi:hypothetical protein